jgi:hypothetical protein
MHRVSAGKPAGCLDCLAKGIARSIQRHDLEKAQAEEKQLKLF